VIADARVHREDDAALHYRLPALGPDALGHRGRRAAARGPPCVSRTWRAASGAGLNRRQASELRLRPLATRRSHKRGTRAPSLVPYRLAARERFLAKTYGTRAGTSIRRAARATRGRATRCRTFTRPLSEARQAYPCRRTRRQVTSAVPQRFPASKVERAAVCPGLGTSRTRVAVAHELASGSAETISVTRHFAASAVK
jgi:hypothetical protein